MYLHLGQLTIVRTSDIVGIFDIETSTISKDSRNYLTRAQKVNEVVNVTEELPKSFVVCGGKGKRTIYISQISSQTLRKRSGFIEDISNVLR